MVYVFIPILNSTFRDENVCVCGVGVAVDLLFLAPSTLDASQFPSRGERPIRIGGWGGHIGVDSEKEEILYYLSLLGIDPSIFDRPTPNISPYYSHYGAGSGAVG
jgi:hypothetical protein